MLRVVPGLISLFVLLLAGCVTTPAPTPPAGPAPVTPEAPATSAKPAPPAAPAKPTTAANPVTPAALATQAAPTPPPGLPPAPVAPASQVEARPATITGFEESSLMFDSLTAYVAVVDGHPVSAGRDGWNTPLALPAGPHRLTVEFNRGVFVARAVLTLNARAAATYQVKFATDAEVFGRNSYCEFWIEEAGVNEPAAPRIRAPLTKLAPPK